MADLGNAEPVLIPAEEAPEPSARDNGTAAPQAPKVEPVDQAVEPEPENAGAEEAEEAEEVEPRDPAAKARREAAGLRNRLKAAEAKLAPFIRATDDVMIREVGTRYKLRDVADARHYLDLARLRNSEGVLDREKLTEAVRALQHERGYLFDVTRLADKDNPQSRGRTVVDAPTWAQALSGALGG